MASKQAGEAQGPNLDPMMRDDTGGRIRSQPASAFDTLNPALGGQPDQHNTLGTQGVPATVA